MNILWLVTDFMTIYLPVSIEVADKTPLSDDAHLRFRAGLGHIQGLEFGRSKVILGYRQAEFDEKEPHVRVRPPQIIEELFVGLSALPAKTIK